MYVDIALDYMGGVHVSYYDADAGDLKFASREELGWFIQTPDAADQRRLREVQRAGR